MNHSNRIPTAPVDQDEASLVRAQSQEDVRISTGAARLNPSDVLLVRTESCGAGTRHRL